MGISDMIAGLIEQMLNEENGQIELRRNDLAQRLGCVPSQINYVISSRFTPERGYIIESRRGGGGYIRIIRKEMSENEYLMHFFYALGDALDYRSAQVLLRNLFDRELIGGREYRIIDAAMAGAGGDKFRADIMRGIIPVLMK